MVSIFMKLKRFPKEKMTVRNNANYCTTKSATLMLCHSLHISDEVNGDVSDEDGNEGENIFAFSFFFFFPRIEFHFICLSLDDPKLICA